MKCEKCGKSFRTLQALKDHFKTVHPNERFVVPKSTSSRNILVVLIVVILVIGSVAGYVVFFQLSQPQTTTTNHTQSGALGTEIPAALYLNLSGVRDITLATVGSGGVTGLTHISGSPLTSDGKPEILYIGGEFCPYCAIQRWSMIVALAKFGTFTGLQYMQSSATDSPASVSTFTFYNATYTSQYVSFVSVEEYDRSGKALQSPTPSQSALFNEYDSKGTIPFLDIGNQFSITTSQALPDVIKDLNWTQIAGQLDNPNSSVAQAIDGAANTLITAICNIDGGAPSNICGQSFAKLPIMISAGSAGQQPILAVPTALSAKLSDLSR